MTTHFSGQVYAGGSQASQVGNFLPRPGRTLYLDTVNGSDARDGRTWENAFQTLERFLDDVETFDRLFFVGDVREEGLIGSNLAFDVQIVGCGGRHHPDNPGTGVHVGSSMIRPPASPTAATPLITLCGRGWEFHNVHFDCPVDAAAIKAVSNASEGSAEYDASHLGLYRCTFQQGLIGLEDAGGLTNVEIMGCTFRLFTPTNAVAIKSTSTAVRVPQYWSIEGNRFPGNGVSGGNEAHIITPLSGSVIRGNVFGIVEGTARYIDLNGGDDNLVTGNLLSGTYDTSDYRSGTNDNWTGNFSADVSQDEVGAEGLTIAVPAAP